MDRVRESVVFYPCPGSGHLGAMVEFAKLIVANNPSIFITILLNRLPETPESAFDALIASVSAASPSITFRHLKSLPAEQASSPYAFAQLFFELPRLSCHEIRDLLESKPKAFVIDFFCNATYDAAVSLGVPTYFFYTSGGCGLAALLSVPVIIRIVEASQETDLILNIPGLPQFPVSDYPKLVIEAEFRKLFESTATNMMKSRGIITNTYCALEERTLRAISDGLCVPDGPTPPVYCVGPLIGANDRTPDVHGKELTWLDSQPTKSVVFLCFGSMGVLSGEQLREIAVGLENSGHRFLWVVRDPPETEPDSLFPTGFLERTKERGLVVKNWAPQKAVLSHDSVGGFVTHCGWNSILEAVCAGVPMLTWPLYAEQKINRTALVGEMRVGLRLYEEEDGFVTAAELEKRVTELMDSDSACGRAVRERVGAMKEAAVSAMSVGGSSCLELAHFVDSLS